MKPVLKPYEVPTDSKQTSGFWDDLKIDQWEDTDQTLKEHSPDHFWQDKFELDVDEYLYGKDIVGEKPTQVLKKSGEPMPTNKDNIYSGRFRKSKSKITSELEFVKRR